MIKLQEKNSFETAAGHHRVPHCLPFVQITFSFLGKSLRQNAPAGTCSALEYECWRTLNCAHSRLAQPLRPPGRQAPGQLRQPGPGTGDTVTSALAPARGEPTGTPRGGVGLAQGPRFLKQVLSYQAQRQRGSSLTPVSYELAVTPPVTQIPS